MVVGGVGLTSLSAVAGAGGGASPGLVGADAAVGAWKYSSNLKQYTVYGYIWNIQFLSTGKK